MVLIFKYQGDPVDGVNVRYVRVKERRWITDNLKE